MTQTIARIKKTNTAVPISLVEANTLLCELGKTQDTMNAIERMLRADIVNLKKVAIEKLQPLITERDVAVNALFTFAQPRKTELTKDLRTVGVSSGTFGWRMTTPRVELAYSDEDAIVMLKGEGRSKFVRTKEEVDRVALLEKKPVVEGISYVQNDEFFVVPNQKIDKPKTLTHAIDCM